MPKRKKSTSFEEMFKTDEIKKVYEEIESTNEEWDGKTIDTLSEAFDKLFNESGSEDYNILNVEDYNKYKAFFFLGVSQLHEMQKQFVYLYPDATDEDYLAFMDEVLSEIYDFGCEIVVNLSKKDGE